MKDKEEKNLQFVLRYYRYGKLDTTKALNKIVGNRQRNNLHRLWLYSSGIAASILICIVSYTLLNRSSNIVSVTANAEITRHFLPDSTLAILAKGSTIEYNSDNYGKSHVKSIYQEKSFLRPQKRAVTFYGDSHVCTGQSPRNRV